jgi:hypothetical protein
MADTTLMTTDTTTSRRALLAGSFALALLPSAARSATAASLTRPNVPDAAWKALAMKVKGGVLRPGDRGFSALTRPQNLRYESIVPLGVARPRDAA